LLLGEAQGLALSGVDLSTVIRDTTTAANNFSGNVNDKFTYTSPSTKYILNSAGIYVPGTTLRTEYDTAGAALGIRIEEVRTNLSLHNRTLANSVGGWTETNVTPTTPGAADMLGGTDVFRLAATASGASSISRTFTGTAAAYTFSFVVKNDTAGWCVLASNDGTTTRSKNFNLAGGALGADGANAPTSSSIEALPNGWYRIRITATMAVATCSITLSITDGDSASDPDAGEAIFADLAQVELGAFATSPIVTAGSTVTRAVDNITLATSAFPWLESAGSFYTAYSLPTTPVVTSSFLWSVSDGTNNERHVLNVSTGNVAFNTIVDGGSVQADLSSGTETAGTQRRFASAYAANDGAGIGTGGILATDSSITLPTVTTLRFGSGNSAVAPTSSVKHLKQFMYLPRRMTNTELQTLTA
jgi:hypothetical protein